MWLTNVNLTLALVICFKIIMGVTYIFLLWNKKQYR